MRKVIVLAVAILGFAGSSVVFANNSFPTQVPHQSIK